MSRLSNYSVGVSSDYRVGELFIDCKSRCPVCQTIQSVYRLAVGWENYLSTVRVGVPSVWLLSRSIVCLSGGELFIDCKSRCPVCLAVHSVYRLTIGWESYLSTVRVGVPSVILLIRSLV